MGFSADSGAFTLEEFYNRGVIKLAPDLLVYIGGSLTTTVIAPVAGRDGNVSFNDGITNVSIQNNLDPPGSSTATVEINAPIYGEKSKYWVTYPGIDDATPVRAPLFVPMTEVKIYLKGRYFADDQPQYYPAFWGFIVNVEENYNGGVFKINLSCADMLHWWAYSKVNIHPVPESNIVAGGQKLTAYATIFDRMNPYQIIYSLVKDMGMHEFVTPTWVSQITPLSTVYPPELFKKITKGIMAYWRQRFANMGNTLKMYGINGRRVTSNGVQQRQPEIKISKKDQKSQTQKALTDRADERYGLDVDFIRKFETFADYGNMGSFENAEYMTKLEIATTIKSRVDFEFFQDTNGNFVFKPPFYNLNVKGIQPYTVLPSEIISSSFSQDTEGIVTVLTVFTPQDKNLRTTPFGRGSGFHMDIDLMNRFGTRNQEITMEYVNDPHMARTLALGQMSQINSKTITGNVTIPGRPEMKLGMPVYIEHRDTFHYVKSINHSFDYAGSFTTTLSLETERRKIYTEEGTSGRYKLEVDKVWRLTGPIPPKDEVKVNKQDPDPIYAVTVDEKKEQSLLAGEQRIISMNQGKYDIRDRITAGEVSVTTTSVPYTDDRGYQVVGAFPYGRNLNAINVLSNKTDLPVLKDVYLTTMARPIYSSESVNMDILFTPKEEGSVPRSLTFGEGGLPTTLGPLQEVPLDKNTELDETKTSSDKKKSQAKQVKTKVVTSEEVKIVTNAAPPEAKKNVPPPEGSPSWTLLGNQ